MLARLADTARVNLVARQPPSSCCRTAAQAPWINIGMMVRLPGKLPTSCIRGLLAQEKLVAVLPRRWVKAVTLMRLDIASSAITRSNQGRANSSNNSPNCHSLEITRSGAAIDIADSNRR